MTDTQQGSAPLDHLIVQSLWFLGIIVTYLIIVSMNDGSFMYTLDDPYIHLALAEQISQGHYGVNAGEVSSPSSSAIWPFLLVPFARLASGDLAPLFLNALCGAATGLVLVRRFRLLWPDSGDSAPKSQIVRGLMAVAVMIAGNALGLAFTGMEHNLQLLSAVVAIDAMFNVSRMDSQTRLLEWWHWAALIGGPLIRYENMALTAAACGFLILSQHWKQALIVALSALIALGAYSGFLMGIGLEPLPNSVQAKLTMTQPGESQSFLGSRWNQLVTALQLGRGQAITSLILVAVGFGCCRRSFDGPAKVATGIAAAGLMHLLVGKFGWFNRYEAYISGALAFGVLALSLTAASPAKKPLGMAAGIFALISSLALSFPYLQGLGQIPTAANNIYEQQYQMHRFLMEKWKRPVAVNDLGWVAYRNDQYVLDLWGLASHEALTARTSGDDPGWMQRLTEQHDTKLAIIYQEAFPEMPKHWIKVAEMRLSRPRITPAFGRVSFYATDPANAGEIETLVESMRKSLPSRITLKTRSQHESTR